jgi:hypothetical protein
MNENIKKNTSQYLILSLMRTIKIVVTCDK